MWPAPPVHAEAAKVTFDQWPQATRRQWEIDSYSGLLILVDKDINTFCSVAFISASVCEAHVRHTTKSDFWWLNIRHPCRLDPEISNLHTGHLDLGQKPTIHSKNVAGHQTIDAKKVWLV